MLAMLAQFESAGLWEGLLFLLGILAMPSVVILIPVFIGLGVLARRRSDAKMERIATIGCFACLTVVLGLLLAFID